MRSIEEEIVTAAMQETELHVRVITIVVALFISYWEQNSGS